MKIIAILGGSFNPIHVGHLDMANIILTEIKSVEIYFVPCGHPVHRPAFQISAQDRLAMVNLAISNHPHYRISTYELDSNKPSHTISTLRHFREKFPDNSLAFILGMDSFLSLDTAWGKNWRDLLTYAHLLVIPRSENLLTFSPALQAFLSEHQIDDNALLQTKKQGYIFMLKQAPLSVSSTIIRQKLTQHDDVSDLLPQKVYTYIQEHRLYDELITK